MNYCDTNVAAKGEEAPKPVFLSETSRDSRSIQRRKGRRETQRIEANRNDVLLELSKEIMVFLCETPRLRVILMQKNGIAREPFDSPSDAVSQFVRQSETAASAQRNANASDDRDRSSDDQPHGMIGRVAGERARDIRTE
jgi:hypothetical protein